MKLSKLFHTLYATVMALPVLIIPIFALNILHKETEPISIEVQENLKVDFNQLCRYEQLNNNGLTYSLNESYVSINGQMQSVPQYSQTPFTRNIQFKRDGTQYLIKFNNNYNLKVGVTGYMAYSSDFIYTQIGQSVWTGRLFLYTNQIYNFNDLQVSAQIFDLTQMFGEGNEPTIEEFNALFPNSYYEDTESQEMIIENAYTTTYDDTDIGSQFVYALYKPVNDYFNFGEFFGLSGMYDWFQLNIFNGTAPLSFFIVFNVMIYWLFISLFWLLFDILIYVPMVIHKWLDKAEM